MKTNEQGSTHLRVGYGERIITPPLGTDLCGYGFYLDRKATTVLDDLKARALVLESTEQRVALVSCDLLGFTVEFSDAVRDEIAAAFSIPRQNVLLACTHTHSGPVTMPLLGMGEMDTSYMTSVETEIVAAVRLAENDLEDAKVLLSWQVVEPIGYNRRTGSFEGIDPVLKTVIFRRADKDVYLFNYACHPVTLGRNTEVSADWAGALIGEIEDGGNRGIFFQGFCGDIDPVTHINQWGCGTREDILLYGRLLSHRATKPKKPAIALKGTGISVREKRISLPLQVPSKEEIERETEAFLQRNVGLPSVERFIREWREKAYQECAKAQEQPFLENVPLQTIAVGDLRIVAVPGEVFCRFGLELQRKCKHLLTIGYANGDIGYIPTESAYENPTDYACYIAPKIHSVFPFSPQIEHTLLREIQEMLSRLRTVGRE